MYYNSYDTTFYYLFTTIYCILTAIYCCYYFLLQFTIFYCKLPHFYRKLPHRLIKIFLKKIYQKLLQFTAIYCIYTAIYNNNLLHLVVLQFYFLLFRHRNTDYFLLRYTTIYCILTAIYCLYYFLLQFTASYRDLPRFTAQVGPQCTRYTFNLKPWPTWYLALVV